MAFNLHIFFSKQDQAQTVRGLGSNPTTNGVSPRVEISGNNERHHADRASGAEDG